MPTKPVGDLGELAGDAASGDVAVADDVDAVDAAPDAGAPPVRGATTVTSWPGGGERAGLVPHTRIVGHAQVLDAEDDAAHAAPRTGAR